MPVTLIIEGEGAAAEAFTPVFAYFRRVDDAYSPYLATSQVSQINAGLPASDWSPEMAEIVRLCHETTKATNGYFNAWRNDTLDPSGLVKGWAINNAAAILRQLGVENFYLEAGGDVQVSGRNATDRPWAIGIRNPFEPDEIVKTVALTTQGIATSGLYIRGAHIYNPMDDAADLSSVASLTVIGPDVYEADRFATAAFAMGQEGINFIESRPGLEGYLIDSSGLATLTSGFERYLGRAE